MVQKSTRIEYTTEQVFLALGLIFLIVFGMCHLVNDVVLNNHGAEIKIFSLCRTFNKQIPDVEYVKCKQHQHRRWETKHSTLRDTFLFPQTRVMHPSGLLGQQHGQDSDRLAQK